MSLYLQAFLDPALQLFRKPGFAEVPLDQPLYKRANIKMEITLEPQLHEATKQEETSL